MTKKREREREIFEKNFGSFWCSQFFFKEREEEKKQKEEENLGFRVLITERPKGEQTNNKQKIQKMSSLSKRARTFVHYIHTL